MLVVDTSILVERHRITSIEIKPEKNDVYLEFIRKLFEVEYGDSISYAYKTFYEGYPCIVIRLKLGYDVCIDILVVASRKPFYEITVYDKLHKNFIPIISRMIKEATYLFGLTGGVGVIYYVYVPGLNIIPRSEHSTLRAALSKVFFGNMFSIWLFSIIVFYILSMIIGLYNAIYSIFMVNIMLVILSNKIVACMGDWTITRKHGKVLIIGLKFPPETYDKLISTVFLKHKYRIKRAIYDALILSPDSIEEKVVHILRDFNIIMDQKDIIIKEIDLYGIVSKVFGKMGLPTPKIVLKNVIWPNAASSGVAHHFSTLLVTSGLLTRLSKPEIEAVIAHEASHVKHHDLLLICALSLIEYFLRLYILLYLRPFAPPMDWAYLIASLTTLFFVAKFIEARADLEAILATRDPLSLSSALNKIDFMRVIKEENSTYKLVRWLSWNPHPPTSSRIKYINEYGSVMKTPWRYAITLCLKDFVATVRRVVLSY